MSDDNTRNLNSNFELIQVKLEQQMRATYSPAQKQGSSVSQLEVHKIPRPSFSSKTKPESNFQRTSHVENQAMSQLVESQKSLDTEDQLKLKTILERILVIDSQKKNWFKFQEMIEEKPFEFEDPTPDFVEGIFFVKVSSWTNIIRCRRPFVKIKICVYDARSFYLFDHKTRLRNMIVLLTESTEFQHLTLAIILLTTLTQIIYNYEDPDSKTFYNQVLDQINTYSTYFYICEFVLQLASKGVFLHSNAYFRDGWNWLDFIVVLSGLTEMTNIPNLPIKGFRAFRVLRPLKSIRQFPRLRKLISGLLNSIPQLLNALFFMLFVFLQFSIFGSQQFGGSNYNRCRLGGDVVDGVWPIDLTQQSLCSKHGSGYTCLGDTVCGSPLDKNLDYHSDSNALIQSFNDYGISNFDDPLTSLLTIFQCITLEGWSALMFNTMNQQSGFVVIGFFTLLVILGAFFLIHVILAVLGYSLSQSDFNQTSEDNIAKEKLAMSLKRRETQLSLQNKEKFQSSGLEQKMDKNNTNDVAQVLATLQEVNEKVTDQHNFQTDSPLTEGNLLFVVETESQKDETAFQNLQQSQIKSMPTSRQASNRRILPEEIIIPQINQGGNLVQSTSVVQTTIPKQVQTFFYRVCTSPYFSILMTLIIVVNAAIMSLEKYPQTKDFSSSINKLNQIFSWIFTAEMIIKLAGLGLKDYVRDKFNLFDALIVILSVVDNIMFYSVGSNASGGGVMILRSIRLLRVFKLARNWKSLRVLISKMINTLPNLASFGLLLFVFLIVFVILGLQFFSSTVYLDVNDQIVSADRGAPPPNNFQNLYNATTTVFAVMMTDNWNTIMYQYYRGLGISAQIYFVGTVIVLNIVLLNLFLALFFDSFENPTNESDSEKNDTSNLLHFQAKVFGYLLKVLKFVPTIIERKLQLVQAVKNLEAHFNSAVEETDEEEDEDDLVMQKSLRSLGSIRVFEKEVCADWKRFEDNEITDQRRKLLSIAQLVKNETLKEIVSAKSKKKTELNGNSLWFMTPNSYLRRFCLFFYNLDHFDDFSNFMVVFSTILLVIDNPLDDPHSRKQFVLTILDYITTAVFSFECFVKICVFGLLINGKKSYFREPWNFLDFFVVLVSLFSYLPLGFDMKFYKSMRLLRILRPLRMIQRNQGLRIAIQSLINVIPGIVNLMLVSGVNLGLLAVFGVNLFKGQFYSCNMDNIPKNQQNSIKTMWDCQDNGGEWVNADQNFDNFQSACSSVFQIMTTEAWNMIATQAQRATNIYQMPSDMASPESFFYFVGVIFIQALFMGNLFIGVVVTTFSAEKEKITNNTFLTPKEYEYLDICTRCYQLAPIKVFTQKQMLRKICYTITDSKLFKNAILICIAANTVLLGCTWYGQSQETADRIEYFNVALSVVYMLEFILRVIALLGDYFQDGWNQLDFLVVICIVVGYIFKFVKTSDFLVGLAVIRVFRVVRLLKLVRQLSLLRLCFQTFIDSMHEILNIGSLLILFLFMFVILGMNLFSNVQLQTNLNQNINFQTFGAAFITLFITSTGENWPLVMADLSRQRGISFQCIEDQSFEDIKRDGVLGCGSSIASIFFAIFYTFMAFIMLNLFSAIILEGFQRELLDEQQKIQNETLEVFQSFWKKYDPNATGMISIEQIENLVLDFVDEEFRIQDKVQVKLRKVSDEILFNFRHKKLLTLSAQWRSKKDDGSAEYYQLQKSLFFQRQLQNQLLRFIGELQIPSYNKFQHFNFYDVLIAFVNFSFTQRQRYEYTQRKIMIEKLRESNQELSKLDAVQLYTDEFYKLSRTDRQNLLELETENFINIIHRVEKKGKRQNLVILKLQVMQNLRRRQALKNKEFLDVLEDQVVSSKLLIAVKTISGFVADWRERNRIRKLRKSSSSNLRQILACQQSQPKSSCQQLSSKNVLSQLDQHPLTLLPSRVNSPERQSVDKVIEILCEEISISDSSSVLQPSVQKVDSETVSSQQPIDRWQEIDVKLFSQFGKEDQSSQTQDVQPTTLVQFASPSIQFSKTSFGAIEAPQPNKVLKKVTSPLTRAQAKTPELRTLQKIKVNRHHSLNLRQPNRKTTISKASSPKLSTNFENVVRKQTGSVKASTLEIYRVQKVQKKPTQEQLHKKILQKMNHKPWRRFQQQIAELEEENEEHLDNSPQTRIQDKAFRHSLNAQKIILDTHEQTEFVSARRELKSQLQRPRLLITPELGQVSESVSGASSASERSLEF